MCFAVVKGARTCMRWRSNSRGRRVDVLTEWVALICCCPYADVGRLTLRNVWPISTMNLMRALVWWHVLVLVNDSMHRDPNQIVKDAVFLAPGRLHGVQREGSNSQGQSYRLQGVHCAVQPVCSPANLSKSKGHVNCGPRRCRVKWSDAWMWWE